MDSVPSGSCIVAGGKVFQGCYDTGDVYAVDMNTGDQIWHRNLNNTEYWVAYFDGKIYTTGGTLPHDPVTRVTGDLYICLDAENGETVWTYQVPIGPGGIGVGPGSISVYEGKAYKSNFIWNATTGDLLGTWMLSGVGRYSTFYEGDIFGVQINVTDYKWYLYRGDPKTQTIKWASKDNLGMPIGQNDVGNAVWSMCTASAENVYVAEFNFYDPRGTNRVFRVDAPTGTIHWAFTAEGAPYSVGTAYNRVYFGTTAGNVYCIDKWTGAYGEIWKFTAAGAIYTDLAIADEKVFFGSMDGYVYALDAWTGDLIWKYRTDGPVTGSPAIADGKLYVASNDRYIYAFGTPPPRPSSSLSLSAPSPITIGDSVTISGKLEDEAGAGIGGADVRLWYRVVPQTEWTQITTVTTASDGSYTYTWTPPYEGYYDFSAAYAGDTYELSHKEVTMKVAGPPPEIDLTPIETSISSLESNISTLTTYLIAIVVLVVVAIVLSAIAAMWSRKTRT